MRESIQSVLEELTSVESGKIIADDIVVENTTYFGYDISTNYMGADFDKKCTYRVNITGYIVRLVDTTENTQLIVDTATEDIINKLKELNFKCNSEDVTSTDDLIKTKVRGYADYNEINNKFIL